MKLFHVLINLAKGIKNSITHSDTNLQEAKDYADTAIGVVTEIEDLTNQIGSGTSSYSITTGGDTRCYRVGKLLFINVRGTTTTTRSDWMSVPLVRLPINAKYLLCGGCSINGSVSYPLVKIGDFSGVHYLQQNIGNSIPNNYSIVLWAIYIIVGGVIRNILTALSGRRCYA